MHILTIMFGVCTVGLVGYLTYHFARIAHPLARALSFMLFSETIACMIIVAFAVAALYENYYFIEHDHSLYDPGVTMSLQWIIFLLMSLSSFYLWLKVEKIRGG